MTANAHRLARYRDRYGVIEVWEDAARTRRTLHFGNAIEQSRYYLHAPFTLGFEYLEVAFDRLMARRPPTLLSLGVGGGRLNTHLYHALPDCRQTLVELRPDVLTAAWTWFDLPRDDRRLATTIADAFFHVQTLPPESQAAIFVDVFDAEGMPAQFATEDFVLPLTEALAPKGLLLMNLWQYDDAARYMLLPWIRRRPHLRHRLHAIRSSPNWILEVERR